MAFFAQNLALYSKNKSPSVAGHVCDRFPRPSLCDRFFESYVFGLIFVVNVKFPCAPYHTIVPPTESLDCLNSE